MIRHKQLAPSGVIQVGYKTFLGVIDAISGLGEMSRIGDKHECFFKRHDKKMGNWVAHPAFDRDLDTTEEQRDIKYTEMSDISIMNTSVGSQGNPEDPEEKGQDRLIINMEDYLCLGVDQFLTDNIINFYLEYLWKNLPTKQKSRVHFFSTLFYKCLTSKPCKSKRKSKHHSFSSDVTLTAAERRHSRVKNLTQKINLFEKDFIIVPINDNAHWFLAIICFPGLKEAQTLDGKPYSQAVKTKKKKRTSVKEVLLPCDDPLINGQEKTDDGDFDESCKSPKPAAAFVVANTRHLKGKVPIKQPCILIFDSLAEPGSGRIISTLRDYLTVEYKTKMQKERVFHKDVIKGTFCRVPQQTNCNDSGLYLLQYVEEFFKSPIKDYNMPIRGIENWFDEIVVTRKREDICNLLKELMSKHDINTSILPKIVLPTFNGKLVARATDLDTAEEQHNIEDPEIPYISDMNTTCSMETEELVPLKVEWAFPKCQSSQAPKEAWNKESLIYSKANRTIRHGPSGSDTLDIKKFKFDECS